MFSFSCAYNQRKEKIVSNISDSFNRRNGKFTGDTSKGEFTLGERLGKFSGNYQFTQTDIQINITQKPIYISNAYIQQVVSAYFERQLIGGKVRQAVVEAAVDDEELELVSS